MGNTKFTFHKHCTTPLYNILHQKWDKRCCLSIVRSWYLQSPCKKEASWDRRQSRLPGKFISGGRRTSSPQKKHILWSPRFALRKPARVLSTTKHNLDQWVLSGGGEIMLKTLKRGERWMPSMCNLLIKSHDKHDRTKKSSIVFSLVGQMLSS